MSPISKWFFDLAERLFGDKKEEEVLTPYTSIAQSSGSSYNPGRFTTTTTSYVPASMQVIVGSTGSTGGQGIVGASGYSGTVGISGVWSTYMYTQEIIEFGFILRFKSDAKLKVSWPEEIENTKNDEDRNKLKKLI